MSAMGYSDWQEAPLTSLNLTDTFLKIHLEHARKADSDSFNLCVADYLTEVSG